MQIRRLTGPRRGVALAAAMLAIVVITALIAGAFFASTQEFRVGRNTLASQRAFAVAEYGLNAEIAGWDRGRYLPGSASYMAPGTVDDKRRVVADGDTAKIKVSRLNENTFWVVSEGGASMGSAQVRSMQRTSAMVRIAYPSVNVRGALTTAGNIEVTGAGHIYGSPQPNATEWDDLKKWGQCTTIPNDSVFGVSVPPTAIVDDRKGHIQGFPGAVERSTVAGADSTYIKYGDETWQTLAANADITVPGSSSMPDAAPTLTTDGRCNTASPTNWGEPWRGAGYVAPCKDYFPIVHVTGNASFHGGRGQGIMLVEGNIDFNGGFEWYGLIIVKDEVNKANGNANVFGAIMARGATVGTPGFGSGGDADSDSWFSGSQNVFFSRCAVESALRGSAILVPVRQRAWAQFF